MALRARLLQIGLFLVTLVSAVLASGAGDSWD